MKKLIALYAIIGTALIAAPAAVHAQNNSAQTPSGETVTPKPKKHSLPFHGKVAAVDTAARTVTVGTLVINVTAHTKITKDGHPATLADIAVGEKISGSYIKDEAGKLHAMVIHMGEKKKKKTEASGGN